MRNDKNTQGRLPQGPLGRKSYLKLGGEAWLYGNFPSVLCSSFKLYCLAGRKIVKFHDLSLVSFYEQPTMF